MAISNVGQAERINPRLAECRAWSDGVGPCARVSARRRNRWEDRCLTAEKAGVHTSPAKRTHLAMKSLTETQPCRTAKCRLTLSLVSVALATGCTLSNESSGGAEGLTREVLLSGPSEESLALWFEPGENPLAALVEIDENDSHRLSARDNWLLGLAYSELGAYGSAALAYQPGGAPYVEESMQCEDSMLADAVEVICDALLGETQRIAFIDDIPHFAQHRVLGRKILQCARDAGFEFLAIEALAEEGAALVARGHVSRTESGVYLREPQFAGMVDDALRLGFTPISFPVPDTCGPSCTPVQAFSANSEEKATLLLAQTLDIDPEAKLLVWAGSGQAFKQPWGNSMPFIESLAYQVYDKTGFDPFSVIQNTLPPATDLGPAADSGIYLAIGPLNGSCAGSYSPRSGTGEPLLNAVAFHVPPLGNGAAGDVERWEWLHTPEAERMAVTPECAVCAPDERLLVQAYAGDADIGDRLPADQAICQSGVSCQLSLPAGQYQLVVWSEEARLLATQVTLAAGNSVPVSMN